MGSTGSGSFSDYSGAQNTTGNSGGSGGSSGTDLCRQAFSCVLQEVAQCDYFTQHGAPPPAQIQLGLVLQGRIFAVDTNGVKVGALPTAYNYLAACMQSGISYVGIVRSATSLPVPTVTADFTAL